jgi:dTDP-4-dehydrorhamnose reductase
VRVAVTGASGRLGRALVAALGDAPFTGPFGPIPWTRPAFDVDAPARYPALLDRDRPEVIVHAAAWTDVEGCARDPELATARNGTATGALARAAAERGVDLVYVSTNEVFGGRMPADGLRGYRPSDEPDPINAYGRSKLEGERLAVSAFAGGRATLGIVRTAWLFGPPGNDFPEKILRAADAAAAAGEPLRLVADETGSPTYAPDLAGAIVDLVAANAIGGMHHVVNGGAVSRAAWAREVLRRAGADVATRDVSAADFPRASTPPLWAVLEPASLPDGEPLRPWQAALAEYLPQLLRRRAAAAR